MSGFALNILFIILRILLLIMTSPYIPGKIFSMHRLSLYCVFMYFIWSFCGIIIALILLIKGLARAFYSCIDADLLLYFYSLHCKLLIFI